MAIQEYVGAVVLEVDGKEIECVSVSNDSNTGYMPVKTMRRKRTISGYCMGIVTHELSVTVPIPVDGDPLDWWNIFDAKLTIYPVSGNGYRVCWMGAFRKYESPVPPLCGDTGPGKRLKVFSGSD